MSVLTESTLRSKIKNQNISEYAVEKGVIITPSARQYLQDKGIKLVYKSNESDVKEEYDGTNFTKNSNAKNAFDSEKPKVPEAKENKFIPRYKYINGGAFENKPEHMTQLKGNMLVSKGHRRIVLRGRLDSLQAQILKAEVLCKNLNEIKVLEELEEILDYVRLILASEVMEDPLPEFKLLGLNEQELKAHSHNPKKYLGTEHIIFPNYQMGDVVVELNSLRAESREVEIVAYNAFINEDGELSRNDIALAMNRLSSCFYVMMCKYVAGKYK